MGAHVYLYMSPPEKYYFRQLWACPPQSHPANAGGGGVQRKRAKAPDHPGDPHAVPLTDHADPGQVSSGQVQIMTERSSI